MSRVHILASRFRCTCVCDFRLPSSFRVCVAGTGAGCETEIRHTLTQDRKNQGFEIKNTRETLLPVGLPAW